MAEHPRAGAAGFNFLGAALMMNGENEAAAAAFRQVIALAPTATAYSNVGVAYYLAGRYADSVVMYRESATMAPDDPYVWMNLGDSLRLTDVSGAEARQAYQKASDLLKELLRINPRDPDLLSGQAHCLSRLGDDAAAMAFISRAIEGAPAEPYNFYYASLVHLEAHRTTEALQAISRAVELNFPVEQLRNDPQFAALRDQPGFVALLDGE
jgi:Flp pilus assembly protein TadD